MKNDLATIAKLTTAELVQCRDRQHWLEERAKSIGGSDSPAILGLAGDYSSPVKVWADKVRPPLLSVSTERQQIGLGMEGWVQRLYTSKFGGRIESWPEHTLARHPDHSHIHCTPDAVVFHSERFGDRPGSFSIKTWSEFGRGDWRDEPPVAVQVQLMQELLVTGWDWGVVAVFFGSQSLEQFYFERNQHFIDALLVALEEFWGYVVDQIEPPMDESAATAKALARLHPDDDGTVAALPAEADAILSMYERAQRVAKACDRRIERIKNQFKAWIGDSTYGVTPDARWLSLKTTDRTAYEVAATSFRTLRTCKAPKGVALPEPEDYCVAERKQLPRWIKRQLLEQDPHCKWCGATLTAKTATLEHVIPLSVGGTNDPNNIALACAACNNKRGSDATLPVETFA